jgi:hypothetical protein
MPGVLESLTVGHLLDSKPIQGQDVRVMTVSSTQVRMRPSAARRRVVALRCTSFWSATLTLPR